MDNLCESEFADEYQDWLIGHEGARRATFLDVPLTQLDAGPLLVVMPGASLRTVVKLMNEQRRGAVLIARDQRLCGIFTERDFIRRVAARRVDLDDTPVASVMTANPDALAETATLGQALRMMVRARYRHIPVIDSFNRPTALVSMRRIIEYVSETFPKEILNAPPERQSVAPPADGA